VPHVKSNRKKAVPQDKNLTIWKVKIPGYIHRTDRIRTGKYAVHILANKGKVKYGRNRVRLKVAHGSKKKRVYPRVYDQAVLDAPIPVWGF